LPSLTLEQIASVIEGKILLGNPKKVIPLAVGGWGRTIPDCITFINDYAAERRLRSKWGEYEVACIVTKASTRINLGKWRQAGISVIEVRNLKLAYMALAVVYRRQLSIPFIQVIGSAGKTTTKEMIGAVLQERLNPRVSYQNHNLPGGVAHNILKINERHRSAVLETGMLGPGDIDASTRMIMPNMVVVTSIQRAHMMRMGSLRKIIAAKAEVFNHVNEDTTLILNGDDNNIKKLPLSRFKGKVVRYGFSPKCDLWASDIRPDGFGTYFVINGKGLKFTCWINTFGHYNIGNALAAVLVGLELGLTENEIVSGLAKFQPVEGRLQVNYGKSGTVIINDNFNANPDSTKLLIKELRQFTARNQVILVLGDMERPDEKIRQYARKVHFEVGKEIAGTEFKQVLAIGKWGRGYVRGAVTAGFPKDRIKYYPTVKAAKPYFRELLTPGVIIVLKASVYTKLRRLIE